MKMTDPKKTAGGPASFKSNMAQKAECTAQGGHLVGKECVKAPTKK